MKIAGFILTRDSWILFWGWLVGIAGLVVTNAFDLKALGLTDGQQKTATAVAALILAGSAKLSTSPLPGKADAQKVTTGEPT